MTEGNVKQEQTEYEDLRAANIRRNEEIMRALGKNLTPCLLLSSDEGNDADAGLDHTDFELHEAHKKKTSLDKSASGKSEQMSKKRKDNSQEDLEQEVGGVRRSARKLGMKAEISDTLPTLPDEEGASHRDARKLKDLSASQTEHENAEREHLRWAGLGAAAFAAEHATLVHTETFSHRKATPSDNCWDSELPTYIASCPHYVRKSARHADQGHRASFFLF